MPAKDSARNVPFQWLRIANIGERQQALIDFLKEAAQFASTTPGWLSARVHRSRDGTRLVNYAQSENLEAAQRIIDRLRKGGWLERNKSLGQAQPGLYDVVFTLEK